MNKFDQVFLEAQPDPIRTDPITETQTEAMEIYRPREQIVLDSIFEHSQRNNEPSTRPLAQMNIGEDTSSEDSAYNTDATEVQFND